MFKRVKEVTKEYEYSKSTKAGSYDIPINFKDCKGNEIYINDVLLYESNKEKIYGKVECEGPEPIIKANDVQNIKLTNLEKQLQEIISIIKKAKECTDPKIKEILIDYCNERIEKLQPKG